MKTGYISHGYRSRRHVVWVEDARSRFEAEGMAIQPVEYGTTNLLNVRRRTIDQAHRLVAICRPGSFGIAHSNGAELLLRAARLGAPLSHLLIINPALIPDVEFPEHVEHVDVFYAPDDIAVVAGKWWRRANPAGWFGDGPMWGTMGREGYTGKDERVRNWNLGEIGHSGALDWDRGVTLWELCANLVKHPQDAGHLREPIFV